jgi:hypothetical protein
MCSGKRRSKDGMLLAEGSFGIHPNGIASLTLLLLESCTREVPLKTTTPPAKE